MRSTMPTGYPHGYRFIVGDDGLRMKNATGTFRVKRSWVVKNAWTRRSGPVGLPEAVVSPLLRWMFNSSVTRSACVASVRRAKTSNALGPSKKAYVLAQIERFAVPSNSS